jgi:hypothetical protein
MEFEFNGPVFTWRGPAPYYFVAVPEDESLDIAEMAPELTYGWGVIPVRAVIGDTEWKTSLFPKDGGYLVPLKDKVRKAEGIAEDDSILIRLYLGALI